MDCFLNVNEARNEKRFPGNADCSIPYSDSHARETFQLDLIDQGNGKIFK
jgi:hypothetical protein